MNVADGKEPWRLRGRFDGHWQILRQEDDERIEDSHFIGFFEI
jgi:hypothetical protein